MDTTALQKNSPAWKRQLTLQEVTRRSSAFQIMPSLPLYWLMGLNKLLLIPECKSHTSQGFVPVNPPAMPDIPLEQLVEMIKGTVKVEVLDGNIGYLKIQHIIGEERWLRKLGLFCWSTSGNKIFPTSAMILDSVVQSLVELSGIPYIVSYFTDPEPLIHIDSVYDRTSDVTIELWSMPTLLGKRYGTTKPLIILTSKNTLGIAEDVAYCLKNLKRPPSLGRTQLGEVYKSTKSRWVTLTSMWRASC